ncbi:MAG TPA: hypothetical protein VK950_03785 [Methylophilus sp.]|nr:hypothetical protein [Methylophilus sp.]
MKKPILPTEIELRFHPSKFLWGWWLVFSMAVLLCLWVSLPLLWAIIGTVIYMIACVWQWSQLVATSWKFSPQLLSVDVFGTMTVTNTSGQRWLIKVLPESVVHHACMVLHIEYLELQSDALEENSNIPRHYMLLWRWLRPIRLLVLFDHADTASQKGLRVWLKWGLRA